MTEKEKMLDGQLYDPSDNELKELRRCAHKLSKQYNDCFEDDENRDGIFKQLIPSQGEGVYFQGPIQFDYGVNTSIGSNTYANFNFVCLDCAPVSIGSNVFFGPNVSLLTPMHPLCYEERNMYVNEAGELTDKEYAKPIVVEDDCWIAGNVTICGGVTIGRGSVIGAGSVVTRDVPAFVLAAGNPCRVIRKLTNADLLDPKASAMEYMSMPTSNIVSFDEMPDIAGFDNDMDALDRLDEEYRRQIGL